jgi:hypothetical protein
MFLARRNSVACCAQCSRDYRDDIPRKGGFGSTLQRLANGHASQAVSKADIRITLKLGRMNGYLLSQFMAVHERHRHVRNHNIVRSWEAAHLHCGARILRRLVLVAGAKPARHAPKIIRFHEVGGREVLDDCILPLTIKAT